MLVPVANKNPGGVMARFAPTGADAVWFEVTRPRQYSVAAPPPLVNRATTETIPVVCNEKANTLKLAFADGATN